MAISPWAIVPSLTKVPESEDRSILSTIFGIPVGFQFATAAGMKGLPALALDIITDPLNLALGGVLKPGLTAAGKAAKAMTRGAKLAIPTVEAIRAEGSAAATAAKLEKMRELSQGLKNATTDEVIDVYKRIMLPRAKVTIRRARKSSKAGS